MNALGLSVNISEVENPKDILPDSFFSHCAMNVSELQHLDPVAAAPVLRKMFCRWLASNCTNSTQVTILNYFYTFFLYKSIQIIVIFTKGHVTQNQYYFTGVGPRLFHNKRFEFLQLDGQAIS